ncbi:hypothetical protein ACTML9_03425 [Porphyromonas levii]|uniref:hypothetical protein n=1 Tax=Porphyromonas levii TaxID=28114 RepID=UPI001070FD28|nr:hypothetical protein [Porphyromonas levii]TFH97708.1 hypothetical protein E4P48_00295 [Porphyromonas levii]
MIYVPMLVVIGWSVSWGSCCLSLVMRRWRPSDYADPSGSYLIERQKEQFLKEGGMREQMSAARHHRATTDG